MNDIEFLLEDEKKKIEEQIMNKHNIEPVKSDKEEKDNDEPIKPKTTDINKRKKKNELIADYLNMIKLKGIENPEWTESKLRRLNKDEIIKLISNFMNEEIADSKTEKKIKIDEETGMPVIIEMPKSVELNGDKLALVAEGIFQINLALVSTLETASHYVKHKTYDIAVLEEWTQKVADKKKELLIIFSQMYLDYKVEFDKYLSPIVQYSIIMLQTGAQCVVSNLKKKNEK